MENNINHVKKFPWLAAPAAQSRRESQGSRTTTQPQWLLHGLAGHKKLRFAPGTA